MHGYSDASNKALGARVYVVYCENGTIHASLLTSKSKAAPFKRITIPLLKLCAAELLVKLMNSVILALDGIIDISNRYYWTDSMDTLNLIYSDKEYKQFVANRVKKIRGQSTKMMWKYCPGLEKSSDIASRGRSTAKLCSSLAWWEGTDWLRPPTIIGLSSLF